MSSRFIPINPAAFKRRTDTPVYVKTVNPTEVAKLNTYLQTLTGAKTIVELEKSLLKQANDAKATYTKAQKTAIANNDAAGAALATANLAGAEANITKYTKQLSDANTALTAAQAAYDKAAAQLAKGQTITSYGTKPKLTGPGNPNPGPGANPPTYRYNAPMVKHAYLTRGIQVDSANYDRLITDPGTLDDAAKAWKDNQGAKGVIQMSRYFADAAYKTQKPTNPVKNSSFKYDDNLYGFKFLYNPTSINMAWGIVEQFSPQFEASGKDKASALSVGLMKSAVTFSLMLNRMGDMSYVDSGGLRRHQVTQTNGINYITQNIPDFNINDIYPSSVSNDDLKLIYTRGTMYDLEYLFRATGGYSSQYKSQMLHDFTADKGWLQPIPVELHLGDGLRYLVRVSSLDVNHIIFNERMVPILTTVNITCTRYFDGPEMFQSSSLSDAFNATPAPATTVK